MEVLRWVGYLPAPGKPVDTSGADHARTFVQWGVVGFVGMGAYAVGSRMFGQGVDPGSVLLDPCSAVCADAGLLRSFVQLQHYRDLNPWLFKMSMQNIDHLLYLADALRRGTVKPLRNDKVLAFSYFRVGLKRLAAFQALVRDKLGVDHAAAVNLTTAEIYKRAQIHLLDIFQLCSEFRPDDLRERAGAEIRCLLQAQTS